ncbi:hypothetical protein ABZ845_24525 [Streptomyces sp. NPDC047022]|uniref:ISAzo13-like element transposase-related protein n=1 Tax=Streptomyces sp. NPDC047022 TaxID=3155737 RepID=UPI003402B9BD
MDPGTLVAIPYGVYDLGQDTGWVIVGTGRDTAALTVGSIRRWWAGRVGGTAPTHPGY